MNIWPLKVSGMKHLSIFTFSKASLLPIRIQQKILFIIFILASPVLLSCNTSSYPLPKAKDGYLNLENWNFEKYGPVTLDGEWKFAWQKLLSPQHVESIEDSIRVPNNWGIKTSKGIQLTQEGFGTYYLKIQLPKEIESLGFYLPIIGHASTIWVNNKIVYQSGKVADSRESMVPQIARNVFFIDQPPIALDMVMQVSNFVHRAGGIDTSILFGPKDQILRHRSQNIFFEGFFAGSLLLTALLHIMIAILLGRKRASLLFALICVNMAFRVLLTGEQLLSYLVPELPWSLEYKLEYITAYCLAVPLISV